MQLLRTLALDLSITVDATAQHLFCLYLTKLKGILLNCSSVCIIFTQTKNQVCVRMVWRKQEMQH
uniref:Uncharacterized protein n=1 Tax=Rhizophora mucronata TaxID=61149 RepID=A0A2P2QIB8_RHIMU